MLAAQVTANTFVPFLADMLARGARSHAHKARGVLSSAFAFGLEAGADYTNPGARQSWGLSINPIAGMKRDRTARMVGERYLDAEQFRLFYKWLVANPTGEIGAALRLALLTGQRNGEIVDLCNSRAMMEDGMKQEPVRRLGYYDKVRGELEWLMTKNGKPHLIPLPRQAVEALDALEPAANGLYFPDWVNPGEPCRGYTRHRRMIARFRKAHLEVPHFTPRDLRRTWKTLTGEAGDSDLRLSEAARDRLQNHTESTVAKRNYDRHAYIVPKQAAMKAWEEYVDRILRDTVEAPVSLDEKRVA
jgi:integrase